MTAFTKDTLVKSGMYIHYVADGERRFIARFKHARDGQATFMTFLRKHFTVEEYFAELDAGTPPLKILESKGYLLPHIKRWLKEKGYEVSRAGFEQMLDDQMAARKRAA
jgi:hypothetical protein